MNEKAASTTTTSTLTTSASTTSKIISVTITESIPSLTAESETQQTMSTTFNNATSTKTSTTRSTTTTTITTTSTTPTKNSSQSTSTIQSSSSTTKSPQISSSTTTLTTISGESIVTVGINVTIGISIQYDEAYDDITSPQSVDLWVSLQVSILVGLQGRIPGLVEINLLRFIPVVQEKEEILNNFILYKSNYISFEEPKWNSKKTKRAGSWSSF